MSSSNRCKGATQGVSGKVQLPALTLLVVQRLYGAVHTGGMPHAVDPVVEALRGAASSFSLRRKSV